MAEDRKNLNDKQVDKEVLNDDQADGVAGGYVFDAGYWAGDRSKPYEVIDDKDGAVLGRYSSKKEAVKMADKKQQTTTEIGSWNELYKLRGK